MASDLLDPRFQWDGTTSDLAQQFYRLHYNLSSRPLRTRPPPMPFLHEDVPTTIQKRLDKLSLRYENLPPLLQRAVVWDSGYVLGDGRYLLRVYTLKNRTMAQIAVPVNDFRAANCRTRNCTQSFRSQFCTGTEMLSVSQCATEDVKTGAVHLSMWATGGRADMVPEIRLLRHEWVDSNSSYLVYAIHTLRDEDQPAWGTCPKASEGTKSALTVPCAAYRTLKNKAEYSIPPSTPLVSAWLEQFHQEQIAASGNQSDQNSSSTTSAPIHTDTKSFNVLFVIPIAVGVLVVLVGVIVWCVVSKRRRRRAPDHHDASRGLTKPFDHDGGMYEDASTPESGAIGGHYGGYSAEDPSTSRSTLQIDSAREYQLSPEVESTSSNPLLRILFTDPHLAHNHMALERFTFERLIAKGAFGEVWLAAYEQRQQYAVKHLLRSKRAKFTDVEDFVAEIQLTASLHHENIIKFVGIAWTSLENLCMVTEYMARGDLQAYLKAHRADMEGKWTNEKTVIALGVARALAYIHSQSPPLIHRDLKAKNVLLADDMTPRLMDFGVSRLRRVDLTMTAGVGTPYWTAPEILEGVRYAERSDVYSFGVLLTELETCQLPYHDHHIERSSGSGQHDKAAVDTLSMSSGQAGDRKSNSSSIPSLSPDAAAIEALRPFQVLKLVMSGKLRPGMTTLAPPWLVAITKRCFDADPEQRPSANELVELLSQHG